MSGDIIPKFRELKHKLKPADPVHALQNGPTGGSVMTKRCGAVGVHAADWAACPLQ
jgi:hypothetical protein